MHWVRSVTDHPSEPKKGGLYGCSVRKSDFWATFGPKKKTKILCWPRCTAGLGAAAAGFSACNCLFDSHNCLLTSLILGPYYKLNWPKRASAVYWLLGTLLYPCRCKYLHRCKYLGKGSKKKSREKYGLLPNPGGGVAEGNEKTKLLFWKSIFSVSM